MNEENENSIDILNTLWDNASVFVEQQQRTWAEAERLLNSRHLTARKPGRSSIFVPKIAGYHRRKMADFVGQFTGDNPVSLKETLTSDPIGAKIRQRVHNHILRHDVETPYETIIYNAAYCGLAYNFAPAHLEWYEEVETNDSTGEETVINSYPVIDTLPPEDVRIDQSVTWNNLDDARYIGFRKFVDANYAADMEEQGKWPHIDDAEFQMSTPTATTGSNLKSERTSLASPFSSQNVDEDNGLIEIRYHYHFAKIDSEFVAVRSVTLLDSKVLEDEQPLDVNWGGNRHAWPFVVGYVYPKPFEQYADGMPNQGRDMQLEANAKRNQRIDNVNLMLNPEKYVTPYAGITPDQLAFSFPGKVVTVDNLNAIQWQTMPDVTSAGYREEATIEQDMDRLFSEGPLRSGVEGRRKESATAIQQMSSNSSAASGLDTMLFMTTFVKPLNEKLGNAIAQRAGEHLFIAAAIQMGVNPQSGIDPVLVATQGDFTYNVYASALQSELSNELGMTSNIMGVVQTAYGPNANYKPLIDKLLELAGHDPDSIIPNPQQQGLMQDPTQADKGGVEPGGNPHIQPREAFQGGSAMQADAGGQATV